MTMRIMAIASNKLHSSSACGIRDFSRSDGGIDLEVVYIQSVYRQDLM